MVESLEFLFGRPTLSVRRLCQVPASFAFASFRNGPSGSSNSTTVEEHYKNRSNSSSSSSSSSSVFSVITGAFVLLFF